jgi:hypothetical protein
MSDVNPTDSDSDSKPPAATTAMIFTAPRTDQIHPATATSRRRVMSAHLAFAARDSTPFEMAR